MDQLTKNRSNHRTNVDDELLIPTKDTKGNSKFTPSSGDEHENFIPKKKKNKKKAEHKLSIVTGGDNNEHYFKHLIIKVQGIEYIKCYYCSKLYQPKYITKDHVVPQKKGGGEGRNLIPACSKCNNSKEHKSIQEFYNEGKIFIFN